MKSNDVLTLLNAGFTREEILAMDADPGAASSPDHSDTLLSADPQPSSQPAEAVPSSPAVEPEPAEQDPMEQMKTMFADFLAQLQQHNRENADMGARIIEPHQQAIETLRGLSNIPTKFE